MSLTTDRNDPCLKEGQKEEGQNECYLILSEEERAKGFVRPVRQTYVHVGLNKSKNELRDLTPEEHERYDKYGYVKFEAYPDAEETGVTGTFWTQDRLNKVNKGCGAATTMSLPLSETYARNPKFYGATFCVGCNTHLPVEEFVWSGTNERVGS